jgi:hypothetical protein
MVSFSTSCLLPLFNQDNPSIIIHNSRSIPSNPGKSRRFQTIRQITYFFRNVLKVPCIIKEILGLRTKQYDSWVESFARNHSIPLEWAQKGVRKDSMVKIFYLDRIRAAYHMGGGPREDYSCFSEIIGQINRAVADRRTIEFGYGFDNLAAALWLQQKDIYYWGDIDTHGFAILNQLRGFFPHAVSFLMDQRPSAGPSATMGS